MTQSQIEWDGELQKTLLLFAEGTLPDDTRRSLLEKIEESPTLAKLVLAYQRAGKPIRTLHQMDARSLARELRSPRFQNSEAFREAWQAHCSLCEVCERKMQECKVKAYNQSRFAIPLRSFATHGLAIAACSVFFLMRTPSPAVDRGGHSVNDVSEYLRGTGGQNELPPLSAEGTLHNLIKPSDLRLDSTIEAWEALPADAEPVRSAALSRLYETRAKAADNAADRAIWLKKCEAARETACQGLRSDKIK